MYCIYNDGLVPTLLHTSPLFLTVLSLFPLIVLITE